MRLVLGVSLTASSAAWVLIDTADGNIVSEKVVALDSAHQIASATARSIQDFDQQTQHDIEGVRLTWSDDAREHGIRLRTKLRLFGFETVETVSQDAAREGLNKTARYFAPHLDLAFGAARSDVRADGSALRRLAARVPIRPAARVPIPVAAAAGAAVLAGVGLYALVGLSPSEAPDTTAAVGTPSQSGPEVGPAPAGAPSALPAPAAVAKPVAVPTEVPAAPSPAPKPVTAWLPATTVVQPEVVAVPDSTIAIELDSTVPETVSARVGQPHLPVAHLPAAPAHLPIGPAQPPVGPAQPVAVSPQFVPPTPAPPLLSSLFSALP